MRFWTYRRYVLAFSSMKPNAPDNLRVVLDLMEREWHEATQAKPISGDDLFRIHTDMTLIKAAYGLEEEEQ